SCNCCASAPSMRNADHLAQGATLSARGASAFHRIREDFSQGGDGMQPQVEAYFHEPTNTASYVVRDSQSKACAIIDSVLDFNAGSEFRRDGSQFDALFGDSGEIVIGTLRGRAIHTPGHTPACMTYIFGDVAFIGDTLFMPDYGTARCDFPGGDARELYRSVQRLLALDPETRLHLCHDYPPSTRAPAWVCTVAEQRAANVHLHDGVDEASFVAM